MLRGGQVPPTKQARALETIERNTQILAHMIDDLLDVSRIVAGKLSLEHSPMRLGPVVAEVAASFEPEARAKALTLETRLDPAAGAVSADETRIRQILANLLVNAMKYTPAGGRIQVDLTAEDGAVRIAVRDTGAGIDRALLAHVFERFRQADWRSAGMRGLGLGLAIVRQLVEMHGGTVRAESDGPGHGATFTVTLPVLPGAGREGL
jgi:signal transduction histidine kinase